MIPKAKIPWMLVVEDQTSPQHRAQSLAKLHWVWRNAGMWSELCWSIRPVGNHQPHGQPPAPGAAATGRWMGRTTSTGKWMVASTSTGNWKVDPWPHTHPDCFQQIPSALANQPPQGGGEVTASPPLGEPRWESLGGCTGYPGCSWRTISPVGLACLIPWPRSMSHFKSYFYSFPPASRLQAGFCTLISLCPFCSWCGCFQTSGLKFSFLVA